MLQRLLAERFRLVVHREPRPMEVHELVVGPGGDKMREVEAASELDKSFPASKLAQQLGAAAPVEALGLRLERRRPPVEVVVVDSINRTPTGN
jgi:hypothetical protein